MQDRISAWHIYAGLLNWSIHVHWYIPVDIRATYQLLIPAWYVPSIQL